MDENNNGQMIPQKSGGTSKSGLGLIIARSTFAVFGYDSAAD